MHEPEKVRIAAVGDIHCGKTSHGALMPMFAKVRELADVLLLCGDLTNYGTPEETEVLVQELGVLSGFPMIAILGNHDVETNQQDELVKLLTAAGVTFLDGEATEILGIGFAGAKGFGGGFGRRALTPWGEKSIKQFVQEGIDEALKLESALSQLRTPQKVTVLHYAPIQSTAQGDEPLEIMPFLGSTRLEEPIDRYRSTVVFHGHAHRGALEGRTKSGIPVYNVAMPLLQKNFPDQPPFKLYELEVGGGELGSK